MFKQMRRIDKQMSLSETYKLLENGIEGVLGTISDNGYPYTVVLNYVYFNGKVYFHCAKEGHKLENIKHHDKVSFTVYDNVEVLGNQLNTLYNSLTLFGRAKRIDTSHEVLMEFIKKYSNIDSDLASHMINKEINDTAIIEVEIDHISGKAGK